MVACMCRVSWHRHCCLAGVWCEIQGLHSAASGRLYNRYITGGRTNGFCEQVVSAWADNHPRPSLQDRALCDTFVVVSQINIGGLEVPFSFLFLKLDLLWPVDTCMYKEKICNKV